MKRELEELKAFLSECREDMHEPDEQSVSGRIVGTRLDNAHGQSVRMDAVLGGYQEMVVVLEKHDPGFEQYFISLATLIALARKAVL